MSRLSAISYWPSSTLVQPTSRPAVWPTYRPPPIPPLQCPVIISRAREGTCHGDRGPRERAVETSGSAAHEQTIQRYRDYVTTSFVAAIEPVAVGRGGSDRLGSGRHGVRRLLRRYLRGQRRTPPPAGDRRRQGADGRSGPRRHLHLSRPGRRSSASAWPRSPPAACRRASSATGAEGIETAMRLAAYTGKHEFITLTHSFHGRTAGTLSITGNKARKTRGGRTCRGSPSPRRPTSTATRSARRSGRGGERCAAMVEWAIDYQSSGDVAAFIAEPVMGEGHSRTPGELFPAGERDPRPSRHPLHRRRGAIGPGAPEQPSPSSTLGSSRTSWSWPKGSPTASP